MPNLTTTGPRYALGLGRSRSLSACATLAEASALYRRDCDAHAARTGKGASTMPEGVVYDVTGASPRVAARISWNGRVWAEKPWAPGDQPLCDPSAGVVR